MQKMALKGLQASENVVKAGLGDEQFRPELARRLSNPYAAYFRGRRLAAEGRRNDAVAALVLAFREGSPLLKERAIGELAALGEVRVIPVQGKIKHSMRQGLTDGNRS
jgi:hypothetical protein